MATDNVIPIQPPSDNPPDGVRYGFVIAGKLEELLEAQLHTIHSAAATIQMVSERLDRITGDEDGVEIAEITSKLSYALDGARELLSTAAWELDLVPDRARQVGRRV